MRTQTDKLNRRCYGGREHPYKTYEKMILTLMPDNAKVLDAGCGHAAPVISKIYSYCAITLGTDITGLYPAGGTAKRQANYHVQGVVKEGYEWCVSTDPERYFDEIPWNLILKLIRRKMANERLVTLIARALKAGIIIAGILEKTTKGCSQGSSLLPVLSDIVLNELNQELEKRDHLQGWSS